MAAADVDSAELAKKTVALSKPAADGATTAYVLTRHYRVQVRDLARWPALVAALLATEHVDSLGVSFDRSDSDQLNRDLMRQAADDARANGSALAHSFRRKLGPAMAITRGQLDKLSAPFIAQAGGGESPPPAPAKANYAVPPSIPFAQAVTAIFRLQ
ncbi:SIMPL domain-containing protein [Pseudoduganella chitinolytica]|uniref:SIMPL domain-containing protein n=1 Tax=Pseudoduganella chitinolytica TaxID=34070 RepID=A0ABY8B9M0_9BURK|nr:SIMPL domain-containing protein [Pseudoduganella chitinolytica]WEF32625.1 SIMPL domain-containing protein [Pseudoduganella chitinolytica]